MNTAIEIGAVRHVEVRISDTISQFPTHQWACVRFLGQDEVVELLCHRMGKSEEEVRQVLENYDRASFTS